MSYFTLHRVSALFLLSALLIVAAKDAWLIHTIGLKAASALSIAFAVIGYVLHPIAVIRSRRDVSTLYVGIKNYVELKSRSSMVLSLLTGLLLWGVVVAFAVFKAYLRLQYTGA